MSQIDSDYATDEFTVVAPTDEIQSLLSLAELVALETGAMLREAFARKSYDVSTKTTPTDLVSEVDVAAEQLIRDRLSGARPDDAILGEEAGDDPGTSGLRWIVDPLDGTANFIFGIPQWAVSIACQDAAGKTLAGVIFDPMRDELWSARQAGPALLNGEPCTASNQTELATALVATGFPYSAEGRATQGEIIARLVPQVRDIRRFGSAALDLAWTAAGRYDAYYEYDIQSWDIAAGALLCERAGLAVEQLSPLGPLAPGLITGPSGLIAQLLPLVR